MPLSQFTATVAMVATNTEYTFGTITPNFDMLDAYVDPGPASGITRLIWRLYSTIGGVTAKVAEVGPVDSATPYRPFAGIGVTPAGEANSGASFELRAVTVDRPVTGVKAGMVGYDMVVNNQPIEVSSNTAPLVYGSEVTFGTIATYHNEIQVQVDPGAALYAGSTWLIYGQITGLAGTIAAVVAEGGIPGSGTPLAPTVVVAATRAGASSYVIKARLTDKNYDGANVTASTSGSDPKLDGTGPATVYYQTVEDNGAAVAQEAKLNFIGFTVVDNPGNNSTDITAAAGGGITELTTDVLAGPGAGVQAATATKATGEITGPGATWWYPNKGGSIGLYNSPDGSPVSIYRQPSAYPGNPNSAYTVINADASNVYVGGTSGGGSAIQTHLTAQHGVFIHGESNRLVRNTKDSVLNGSQSIFQIWQPDCFANIETYLGGAAPFTCDTGLYATTFIECNFGAAGGTINLPAAEAGRVLNIGDAAATISAGAPLILNPGAKSINGGAPGASLTINTPGWAGKLVLNSATNNWILF